MKTIIFSFVSLFSLWGLLSGYFKLNLVVLGVLSCIFVTFISIRLKIYNSKHQRLHLNLRLPLYIPWLLKEIIISNLHVARCILIDNKAIKPQLVNIQPSQETNVGVAVLANSITLTPGTISIDIDQSGILVHALTNHTAKGILDGDINKQVSKLEGTAK